MLPTWDYRAWPFLPHWPGEICPSLGYLAPLSNPEDRWGLLVRSSARLGTEFTRAWVIVGREATQISEFFGEELSKILDVGAEDFRLGVESGSRQVIFKEREALLSKVLKKSF